MIDFSHNKFSQTPFNSKRDLSYRYKAIQNVCDESACLGYPIFLDDYQTIKKMDIESIKILFALIIKEFAHHYTEHMADNL